MLMDKTRDEAKSNPKIPKNGKMTGSLDSDLEKGRPRYAKPIGRIYHQFQGHAPDSNVPTKSGAFYSQLV